MLRLQGYVWVDMVIGTFVGGVRSPSIVVWPNYTPPASRSEHIWAFWDVLPTMADIAGVKAPVDLDGVSFYSVLRSGVSIEHSPLLFTWSGNANKETGYSAR